MYGQNGKRRRSPSSLVGVGRYAASKWGAAPSAAALPPPPTHWRYEGCRHELDPSLALKIMLNMVTAS